MKLYLPYSSECRENEVKNIEIDTDQINMQKNCFVNLFNKDSEEHKMFSIKISDFWYKNKIEKKYLKKENCLNK